MKKLFGIACLSVIVLSGCSALQKQTLQGSLTVVATYDAPVMYRKVESEIGKECSGGDVRRGTSFDDLTAGAQILVKDSSGKLVATGRLEKGMIKNLSNSLGCVFALSVPDLPRSDFYTIEIGDRKGMTYSAKELQEKNWTVELSIGA